MYYIKSNSEVDQSGKAGEESKSEEFLGVLFVDIFPQVIAVGSAKSEGIEIVISIGSALETESALEHVVLTLNHHILESVGSGVKVAILNDGLSC